MIPTPGKRTKRIPLPALVLGVGLVVLLGGMSAWILLSKSSQQKQNGNPSSTEATGPGATNGPGNAVSPLLFGTNLALFDDKDQVLNSAATRATLQQIHPRIIRIPVRTNINQATEVQVAQIIKSVGAIPLVSLRGIDIDPNALAEDTTVINAMNSVFGNSLVYYEYGNEEDLLGVPVDRYIPSWNSMVPQLKRIAHNAEFIGPVNYQYNRNYLTKFLQQANPQPDAISWHEYTCDDGAPNTVCISHIDNWTNHITSARSVMQSTLGKELPIMITEWNYAPNATPNDGKNNDSNFMSAWTTKALQTLAANRVFASMQYSCTNTPIPLISDNGALTTQGMTFQAQYQRIITSGQQPAAVASAAANQPTPAATTSTAPNGPIMFSFEDGGTDGWSGHSQGIANVQNSTDLAQDGSHALKMTLSNASSGDYPYVSVGSAHLPSPPRNGQTITAYVYMASNSVSVRAKLFVMDNNFGWHTGAMVDLMPGTWTKLTYTVPQAIDGPVRQLGIQFNSPSANGAGSDVYIDAIGWS